MKNILTFLCIIMTSTITGTPMLDVLDGIEQLMTGKEAKFDRVYYWKLKECLSVFHSDSIPSHNSAWSGLIEYWKTKGNSDDVYGMKLNKYSEQNITAMKNVNLVLYEPCNFASSLAYYRPITEICARMFIGDPFYMRDTNLTTIVKSFLHLTFSSSFMHASNTNLGLLLDHTSIALLGFVVHQTIMEPFKNSSILYDLSLEKRSRSSSEFVGFIERMFADVDVHDWNEQLSELDLPDRMLPAGAVICTLYTILYEKPIVDSIAPHLIRLLGVENKDVKFIINHYLPTLRKNLGHFSIGILKFKRFLFNSIGTVIKLLYGLAWREVVPDPVLESKIPNYIGELLLPKVNFIASILTDYQYYDKNFQQGRNTYPGDGWCNKKYPHSKWHVETAVGLLDYVYLADIMHIIVSKIVDQQSL